MARTLGGDPNQVVKPGRRTLTAWGRASHTFQTLLQDITLGKGSAGEVVLMQQFIPELKMLRKPGSYTRHELVGDDVVHADQKAQKSKSAVAPGSPLAEVVATFELSSEFLNDDDSERKKPLDERASFSRKCKIGV